jgi:hypothetical protein
MQAFIDDVPSIVSFLHVDLFAHNKEQLPDIWLWGVSRKSKRCRYLGT